MNNIYSKKYQTVLFVAATLATVMLCGCQTHQNHEKWVKQADSRYNKLRSSLMLDMAKQQFSTGDLDQAERTVKDAAAVDPKNAKLRLLAGRIALERGQLERAYRQMDEAIDLDPKLADAHYYQGLVLQRWQRYSEAQARYAEAYKLKPDKVGYLLAQVEMMVESGQVDPALALLEEKKTYFAASAALRTAIGRIYMMKKEALKAVPYFRQASLLDPSSNRLKEDLATAQWAAGDADQAAKGLEALLKNPEEADRADLRRTLGQAYLKTGRIDNARQTYLELARSQYGDATDWLRVGEISLKTKDLFGALEASRKVMQLDPQQQEAYVLAGIVWQKRDKLDEALRMFDRAAQLEPTSATPLILRGISLEHAGRKTAAIQAYREALKRQPDDARAKQLLQNVSDVR